jgi:hypothetical protein
VTEIIPMRLCRYQHNGTVEVALYQDEVLVPVNRAADELMIRLPAPSNNMLDYLPPEGRNFQALGRLDEAFRKLPAADQRPLEPAPQGSPAPRAHRRAQEDYSARGQLRSPHR